MLQVSQHIVQLDYPVSDTDASRFAIAQILAKIYIVQRSCVKVHAGAHQNLIRLQLLNFMDDFVPSRSSEKGIVMFILHNIFLVELARIFNSHD